jgi:hypothetical protein
MSPGRGVLSVVNTGCPPASYGTFYFRFPFGTCVVRSKPRTVKYVNIWMDVYRYFDSNVSRV